MEDQQEAYSSSILTSLIMDYDSLYQDVNQISIRLEKTDFSEVMVMHRMFVRMNDLDVSSSSNSSGLLQGAEKVKKLYVFADVVELPSNSRRVRLPATDSITIVCRMFVREGNHKTDLFLPHITKSVTDTSVSTSTTRGMFLTSTAPSGTSSAQALRLNVETGQSLKSSVLLKDVAVAQTLTLNIVGTRAFQIITSTFAGNIWFVRMTAATGAPALPALVTDPNIILGMQVTVLIAELVKTAHNSDDLIAAVTRHVEWLNSLLIKAREGQSLVNDDDVVALLSRTQGFLKLQRPGLVVPRLQYSQYKNLIDRMVQIAQDYDKDFRQLKTFVAQNQILGSYLLDQNKVFAEKEKDMDAYHNQIITLKKTELTSTLERMDQLSNQMDEESAAMEKARDDMEAGLIEYQNKQVANAFFAVVGAIASVALAFVTGGATAPGAVAAAGQAVTAAGKLAEGLKKVVEILEGLQVVMETVAAIKQLVQSIKQIGKLVDAPEMPELPSNADWDIFVNEVEAVAETMPTEVTQVPTWKAKSKNVAALGREMCTMAAYISELQFDILVQTMLREIAEKQADRLASLQPADLTSYLEMVSQIDMRTTRMLLELIRVFYIQNAALQYEYLQTPAPLNAWPVTMQTVWTLLVQQEIAAVTGLIDLGPSSDFTKSYVVKHIPTSLLRDGKDWEFEIPVLNDPSHDAFPSTWSRVRINYVEVRFVADSTGNTTVHLPNTSTGQIYVLLQASRFLNDRAKRENEYISYEASAGVPYQYAYRLETGETTLSNKPSDEYLNTFMRMTPFTRWRLRLSSSAEENKGLTFPTATSPDDDTTEATINFFVTAIRRISTKIGDT